MFNALIQILLNHLPSVFLFFKLNTTLLLLIFISSLQFIKPYIQIEKTKTDYIIVFILAELKARNSNVFRYVWTLLSILIIKYRILLTFILLFL